MGKKIKNFLILIYKSILEIIYPRDNKCILCGKEDNYGICERCKTEITKVSDEELCIGYYKGNLKELILRFKYKKDFIAGEILVELIEGQLLKLDKKYILTYIY